MGSSVTGGCLCGEVRYRCEGSPGPANYCHCIDCRRITGSAFNIGVRFAKSDFVIETGEPGSFTKCGDSGGELTRHFCAKCGSPLFTTSPKHPETIYVKAGSLDDPSLVRPADQIWTGSTVPWAFIPQGLPSHLKGRV